MASEAGGGVLSAADFFGANDPDGVDKFKTIAMRALYDQKVEEELKQTRTEKDRLALENKAMLKELKELKASLTINIDDRERVLAFKSKRIEELLIKVKEYEAINASLLQTINGDSAEPSDAGRNTATSLALLQNGHPLFHAVETCKEQELKRQLEDKKLRCEQLQGHIAENEALVSEMQGFQQQKDEMAQQTQHLEAMIAQITLEKDEKIHFLERKLVFEHDRLTREKDSEIESHQNDMEKQMRMQLDVTTQRTIEENARVQLELRYQSTQLEKMVKQMDSLLAENRQATQERRLVEEMNLTLSKKIKFYEQLFAKMQQKDQVKSKQQQQYRDERVDADARTSPVRRKPPLPSLANSTGSNVRSAFALSQSPPRSPQVDDTKFELDLDSLHLVGDQLNSATAELDAHMLKRDFARKEVKAMLHYHQQSPHSHDHAPASSGRSAASPQLPLHGSRKTKKKKVMLSRSEYSPSSYAPRGARRLREAPLTLDAFIQEHATISPRNRTYRIVGESAGGPDESRLPSLPLPHAPSPRVDASELWRSSSPAMATTTVAKEQEHALTARF